MNAIAKQNGPSSALLVLRLIVLEAEFVESFTHKQNQFLAYTLLSQRVQSRDPFHELCLFAYYPCILQIANQKSGLHWPVTKLLNSTQALLQTIQCLLSFVKGYAKLAAIMNCPEAVFKILLYISNSFSTQKQKHLRESQYLSPVPAKSHCCSLLEK